MHLTFPTNFSQQCHYNILAGNCLYFLPFIPRKKLTTKSRDYAPSEHVSSLFTFPQAMWSANHTTPYVYNTYALVTGHTEISGIEKYFAIIYPS